MPEKDEKKENHTLISEEKNTHEEEPVKPSVSPKKPSKITENIKSNEINEIKPERKDTKETTTNSHFTGDTVIPPKEKAESKKETTASEKFNQVPNSYSKDTPVKTEENIVTTNKQYKEGTMNIQDKYDVDNDINRKPEKKCSFKKRN